MSAPGGGGGASGKELRPIIIKKIKKQAAGHHGGAWKVAYADFVTAMMAFFMVMWLVASVTKEQRAAIFDYFNNPSMEPGKSVKPSPGQMGPGGASTSVINMGGGLDARRSSSPISTGIGTPMNSNAPPQTPGPVVMEAAPQSPSAEAARKAVAEADHKKLESLEQELRQAIDQSQALKPFKDQLLLDITPEGLRIQIVDAQNRPMFDMGSARIKDYTGQILHELAPYLNTVPNKISISGHTDTTPYAAGNGQTNWDLSADRANAARRALEGGGLSTDKVARVVGLSSSVLFDKANARNPINRRISIIVMTRQAEEAAEATDSANGVKPGDASDPAAAAAAPAATPPSMAEPAAATAPVTATPPAAATPATAAVVAPAAAPAVPVTAKSGPVAR
ncbi:MAG TPA: flagellar motor protein MotB [Steroidobacteraceae bacterium]|jgi:chemotaxis protein MotB